MSYAKSSLYIVICAALVLGGVLPVALSRFSPQQLGPPPWQVETQVDGYSQVFGITLGQGTVLELSEQLHAHAQLSLFVDEQGGRQLEAFWDSVRPGGISAKLVANLALPAALAERFYQQGARIRGVRSGGYRVDLAEADKQAALQLPIEAITCLLRGQVDLGLLEQRFGEPSERRQEPSGTLHLLYPHLGLEILYSEQGAPILQYVPPKDFARLLQPLETLPSLP